MCASMCVRARMPACVRASSELVFVEFSGDRDRQPAAATAETALRTSESPDGLASMGSLPPPSLLYPTCPDARRDPFEFVPVHTSIRNRPASSAPGSWTSSSPPGCPPPPSTQPPPRRGHTRGCCGSCERRQRSSRPSSATSRYATPRPPPPATPPLPPPPPPPPPIAQKRTRARTHTRYMGYWRGRGASHAEPPGGPARAATTGAPAGRRGPAGEEPCGLLST